MWIRICVFGMRIWIQEQDFWPEFTSKAEAQAFKKLRTYRVTTKTCLWILLRQSLTRIGIRTDPRWLGSLDPDPHWDKKAGFGSALKTMQILNNVLRGPDPWLRIHKSKLRNRLYRIRFRNDGLIFIEGEHFRDLSWRPVEIQFFSSKILCSYYSTINQMFYIGRGIGTLPVRDCRNGIAYHYHQFNQFNSVERPLIFKLAVEMYFIILGYYYTWLCSLQPVINPPDPALRIRDVYPGSRILIFTHPGWSDLGSRIQKQLQKRGMKKKFVVIPFFVATNFTKFLIILFLNCWRKKFGSNFKELQNILPKKSQSYQKY